MRPMIPFAMPYLKPEGSRGEPTRDMFTMVQYKIGQVSPRVENGWNMAHGRHLAGLSGVNEVQQPWAPEEREESDGGDAYLRDLEREDDVYGSGVFDVYGRPGTINPNLGCFADHPSLPGYVDREVLYHVHKDISDITNGADVIVVAPGGMTYQERGGRPVDYDGRGTAPCRPDYRPPPPTGQDDVYVSLTPVPKGRATPRLPPSRGPVFVPLPEAARPTPRMPPSRSPSGTPSQLSPIPFDTTGREVPLVPTVDATRMRMPPPPSERVYGTPFRTVPPRQASHPVPGRSTVNTAVSPSRVGGALVPPSMVAPSVRRRSAGWRNTSNDDQLSVSVSAPSTRRGIFRQRSVFVPPPPPRRGMGAATNPDGSPAYEDDSPGFGTYLFAGLAVGAAAAMLYGATKMGKR